jgi:hypothetical protein
MLRMLLVDFSQGTVGAVFAIACLIKLWNPNALADTIAELTSSKVELPRRVRPFLVRALATAEGVLGLAWFSGHRWAPVVTMCFLCLASWVLLVLHRRGYPAPCGCFGSVDVAVSPVTRGTVNLLLFVFASYVWWEVGHNRLPFRPVWELSQALLPILMGTVVLGSGAALARRAVARQESSKRGTEWRTA